MSADIVFDKYLLMSRLAKTRIEEVLLCRQIKGISFYPLLTLKRLHKSFSQDQDIVRLFLNEANTGNKLQHPNIEKILDYGQHQQQLYLVSPFLHAKDLKIIQRRALIKGEMIPYAIVAYCVARVAQAINYAHTTKNVDENRIGIWHLNICPQNILLAYTGELILINFGMAKIKQHVIQVYDHSYQQRFEYFSPEQANKQKVTAQSDIFSLGVLLYEMLTETLPFGQKNDLSTLENIARADYVSPECVNPHIPFTLVNIVHRALRKNPAKRYMSASSMADELHEFVRKQDPSMNQNQLSLFMHRLFSKDYEIEKASIETLFQSEASENTDKSTAAVSLETEEMDTASDTDLQKDDGTKTPITASPYLAAGYDITHFLSPQTNLPICHTATDTDEDSTDVLPAEFFSLAHALKKEEMEQHSFETDTSETENETNEEKYDWSIPTEVTDALPGMELKNTSEEQTQKIPSYEMPTCAQVMTYRDIEHLETIFEDEDIPNRMMTSADRIEVLRSDSGIRIRPVTNTANLDSDVHLQTENEQNSSDPKMEDDVKPAEFNMNSLVIAQKNKHIILPRFLTEIEISILVLAGAIGITLVIGAYWLATTMPLEKDLWEVLSQYFS